MKPSDYKCSFCGKITEFWVKDNIKFPQSIICICGYHAKRKFSPAFKICHQGKCGNDKTGYTSNPISIKKT